MTLTAKSVPSPEAERLYTADELLRFPDTSHYELVEGNLREMAPTGDFHGVYTSNISIEIGWFVRQNKLGETFAAETGFLIRRNPDTVKAPDFAFISHERLTFPRGTGFVPAVPDLVLETRSPSDRPAAVATKIQEWLEAGVRLAIDLDPAKRTLTVYQPGETPKMLSETDTLEGGEVLPGFTLPLSRLFA
jgi:Uma2 family endonuclease